MRKHFGKRAGFGVKRNVAVSGTGLPYSCMCVCTQAPPVLLHTGTHTHTLTLSLSLFLPPPSQIFSQQHLRHLKFCLRLLCPGLALTLPGQGGLPLLCALPVSGPWAHTPPPFPTISVSFWGHWWTVSPCGLPLFLPPPASRPAVSEPDSHPLSQTPPSLKSGRKEKRTNGASVLGF